MRLKLDLKSVLVLVLLGFCILFFSMWFLKGTEYKKEFKLLDKKYERLQHIRDSLVDANSRLKSDFDNIQTVVDQRNKKITKIESDLKKTKYELSKANSELSENKHDLEETKKKIEKLKKEPIKREGDDLLNSLKEKLK
jgi:peptidoglycan hydrolase CwlO-like protein